MNSPLIARLMQAAVVMAGASVALAEPESGTPATPDLKEPSGHAMPGPGDVPVKAPTDATTAPADMPLDEKILSWYGTREQLEKAGLTFEFTLVADESVNLKGGADTENEVFRHLFDARFTFDTEKAGWWKGGSFSVDFQNQNGRNGTDLYGDAQGFDNIDGHGLTQISELWYEQKFSETLRLKLGKVDANTEFANPDAAGQFINSSFGYSPTITGFPTYPDPALSANLTWAPVDGVTLKYGIYDGGDGQSTGSHPPHTAWTGETDYFHIAEAGFDWELAGDSLPGRLAVGVSYANGRFERFRGGEQNGTQSLYLILEQKVFTYAAQSPDNERGVYAFAQFGTADEEVNDIRQQVSAGLNWVGPYRADHLDSLGLGITSVFFTDATGSPYTQDSETAIEAYYNFQATQWLSIKPDLQYIVHPGGDTSLDDMLVATLRVTLAL